MCSVVGEELTEQLGMCNENDAKHLRNGRQITCSVNIIRSSNTPYKTRRIGRCRIAFLVFFRGGWGSSPGGWGSLQPVIIPQSPPLKSGAS